MIYYRKLDTDEINEDLFNNFTCTQVGTNCLRKDNGRWITKYDHFIDDWNKQDYEKLITN